MYSIAPAVLALTSLWGVPLEKVLIGIAALAVLVLVGRVVLGLVWKVLLIAGLVVGALYAMNVVAAV